MIMNFYSGELSTLSYTPENIFHEFNMAFHLSDSSHSFISIKNQMNEYLVTSLIGKQIKYYKLFDAIILNDENICSL